MHAEAMVDSMLRDSPLTDPEKGNEKVPKDGGSDKLPQEGEGEKLREGGGEKQPEETPAGKLVSPCRKSIFFPALNLIKQHIVSLDSQNTGNTIGMIEDVPKRAVSALQASASHISSGSVLPREKVELAFKLLEVSSRVNRVLYHKSSDILICLFLQEAMTGGWPVPG